MTIHDLDAIEKASIRGFIESCAPLFTGRRVLDYGCGKKPYAAIIEDAGGEYLPYDRAANGGGTGGNIGRQTDFLACDTILCTQMIQYHDDPDRLLLTLRSWLDPGDHLVLTYPSAWPVIRDELWHFTRLGMERIVAGAGFTVVRHELRHALQFDGFEIPVGYALVGRA